MWPLHVAHLWGLILSQLGPTLGGTTFWATMWATSCGSPFGSNPLRLSPETRDILEWHLNLEFNP